MDNLLQKTVVQKGFKNMIVLGVGLAVTMAFAPVTTWASIENQAKQTCRFNAQSQNSGSNLMRISSGERIIMARGGNRSADGSRMGQRAGGNSESGYNEYGPAYGTGYGAKKGAGTRNCDGTGPKGKGRGKGTN